MYNHNKTSAPDYAPGLIDPSEFAVAETAAETETEVEADAEVEAAVVVEDEGYTFTHKFREPFVYMGKGYTVLHFDWGSLIGADSLAIEAELAALGVPVLVPSLSAPYLIRMAAKACTDRIGADAFELMPLRDFTKIRNAARSFLLASE